MTINPDALPTTPSGEPPASIGRSGRSVAGEPASAMARRQDEPPASMLTQSVRVAVAASAVGFFLYCMLKFAITPDVYWLWRGGQYILAEGRLPATDIFSWTFADQPVLLYQWLFMVGIAAVEAVAGLRGAFVLFVMLGISVYLLAPLFGAVPRKVSAFFVIAACALGLATITINLALRPMIMTSAFLLAQYVIVQRSRGGQIGRLPALVLSAVVYALWANFHNGIVLGYLSLFLFALGDFAERRGWYRFEAADPDIEGRPLPIASYIFLLTVALAASLANPYGVLIYAHLASFTSQGYFAGVIEELRSPNFQMVQFQWFLVFVAGLFVAMTRITRLMSAADLLHLVVFTVLTLAVARFVVWAVLLYVLVMPRVLHHATALGAGQKAFSNLQRGSAQTRRVVGIALAGMFLPFTLWVFIQWPATDNHCVDFAGALASYQKIQQPTDRLFNSPGIGSCAMALSPYPRVFIDTRFDVYGEQFTGDAVRTLRLRPSWRELLNRWRIDTIVVESSWALAQGLALDPQAKIIFDDGKAVVARWSPQG
ncbi:MAG: hypothetical protein ACREEE_16490 [Dongiaceae bacterium]